MDVIKLKYTEDFKIACKINNLEHKGLLQYFIDHVSFYAFIGGDMELPYLWATTVSIDCKEVMGKKVEAVKDQRIQNISLKYIKMLTALHIEEDLSASAASAKSISLMKKWAAEMGPLTDYQAGMETSYGEQLKLTFDFNLLCSMNGVSVQHQLQYFIDKISLANERAVNLIQPVKTDPSTAVLLLLVSSHAEVRNKILPHQEIYKKYGLWLLKLDKKQKEENNLENRIRNYSAFYLEWYHALSKE